VVLVKLLQSNSISAPENTRLRLGLQGSET